jgi:hypothetical protein
MKRLILAIIALNLAGIIALAFFFPAPMLAPGPLIPDHANLASDCFACHLPMQGAVAARCTTCHTIAEIGVRTIAGAAVTRTTAMAPFHQGLADTDCMSCHTDHPRASLVQTHSHTFAHDMLLPEVGDKCAGCHTPPADAIHPLPTAQCSSCHTQTSWAGAAIDHTRFFALTGPHDVSCTSCHTTLGDFTRYTCFSCHEHREASLVREHLEEGIRNIDNCVDCHRSAHSEGRDRRERRGDDDDD